MATTDYRVCSAEGGLYLGGGLEGWDQSSNHSLSVCNEADFNKHGLRNYFSLYLALRQKPRFSLIPTLQNIHSYWIVTIESTHKLVGMTCRPIHPCQRSLSRASLDIKPEMDFVVWADAIEYGQLPIMREEQELGSHR